MAIRLTAAALTFFAAAQASASVLQVEPGGAPAAPENAAYCLKVEAITGTRLESVVCRTRSEWAEWGIDVDKEWAKEGVRVVNA